MNPDRRQSPIYPPAGLAPLVAMLVARIALVLLARRACEASSVRVTVATVSNGDGPRPGDWPGRGPTFSLWLLNAHGA